MKTPTQRRALRTAGSTVFHRRRHIGLRLLAAVAGGYLTASLLTVVVLTVLRAGFGAGRPAAVAAATLLAAPAYVIAALWAFGAASTLRAWFGLLLPCMAMAILLWVLACFGLSPP